MKPLTLRDLLPADAWEAVRGAFRGALIAHKAARRVALGDRVTVVFEDRETLRWQVQEMARVEQLRGEAQLQAELDVYNDLIPGEGELSATLFIEITDLTEIRPALDRLVGIDEHVALVLGAGAHAVRVPARFDSGQMEEERISAVHYLRFALDAGARRRLEDPAEPARLVIDHPAYRAEAVLAPETRASLAADLRGGARPLIDLAAARAPEATRDAILEEGARLRVRVPAHPAAPGHRVVEARDPALGFADAPPELLGELLEAVRRHAAELRARHGGCQLQADLGGPLRWHLLGGSS